MGVGRLTCGHGELSIRGRGVVDGADVELIAPTARDRASKLPYGGREGKGCAVRGDVDAVA